MVFLIRGPPCLCALHVNYSHMFLLLSRFFLWVVVFPTSDGPTFFIRVYRTEYPRLLRAQYVESSIGRNRFSSSRRMVLSPPISWKSTWPRSQSLVTLLLIYSATKRRCVSFYMWLHWTSLSMECIHFGVLPLPLLDIETFEPMVSGVFSLSATAANRARKWRRTCFPSGLKH